MALESEAVPFLFAAGIGILIGLQREIEIQQKRLHDIIGVRTFTLIALFGALMGYFGDNTLFLIAFCSASLLLIANFVVTSLKTEKAEMTTEITALITFLLAALCTKGYENAAVIIAIITVAILTLKKPLHEFAKEIQALEVQAAIKFGVITLVVLPFLPKTEFSPLDIPVIGKLLSLTSFAEAIGQLAVFNPYKIWLMVVFISGISFVGYILVKTIGANKGIGITGFLGGLVSSTAVTSSLAIESKRNKSISQAAVVGVLIACSVMFLRVLFEILVLNVSIIQYAYIPFLVMAGTGFIVALLLWTTNGNKEAQAVKLETPFALLPALKFGLFFAFVLFVAKFGQLFFGTKGIIIASIIAGLADVDAITLSLSNLALIGDITGVVAVTGITCAAMTNTLVKSGIARMLGDKEFSRPVMAYLVLAVVLGLASLLLMQL